MSPNMPTFLKGNLDVEGHLSSMGGVCSVPDANRLDTGADQNFPKIHIDVLSCLIWHGQPEHYQWVRREKHHFGGVGLCQNRTDLGPVPTLHLQ